MPDQPLVTVLMPVRNEADFIGITLAAVLAQDYPTLEVLVIDGESEDETVAIVQRFQAQDQRVQLLHNPARWQVRALNLGIQTARGEIIARVDGHTLIAPDYIRRAVEHLLQDKVDNVGGPLIVQGRGKWGEAIAASYRSPFAVPSPSRIARQRMFVDSIFHGVWPRKVFERVGFFNEKMRINEDYEHNYRIRKSGGKILLTTDLHFVYFCRDNLPALWKQYYNYGYGKFQMLYRYPEATQFRQIVPPAFVAALFFGGALSLVIRPLRILWLSMIGIYLLLSLIEAWRQSRGSFATFWRLPLVFAVIHLAWGLGFWRSFGEMLLGSREETTSDF